MIQSKNIQLTPREEAILKATIEDYIETIQPVGSSFLKRVHHFDWSPATIRHSLARLESFGLLTHPFTSAGRMPTDAGYRYYVDHLMNADDVDIAVDEMLEELKRFNNQIDNLLSATAIVLARSSQLLGVVLLSNVRKSILTGLELIELSSERIMLVLEVDSGLIQSLVLNLNVAIDRTRLAKINRVLREMLIGLTLEDIRESFQHRVQEADVSDHEIVQILLKKPAAYFSFDTGEKVFTSSFEPLLQYPEFQNIEAIRDIISGLSSGSIKSYLKEISQDTVIGHENEDERFHDCAILKCDFHLDSLQGRLAVIGPKRLPYRIVSKTLNTFAELLPYVI